MYREHSISMYCKSNENNTLNSSSECVWIFLLFLVFLSLAAVGAQCFPHNLFLHNFTETHCNLILLYNPFLSSHIGPTVWWWHKIQILPKKPFVSNNWVKNWDFHKKQLSYLCIHYCLSKLNIHKPTNEHDSSAKLWGLFLQKLCF